MSEGAARLPFGLVMNPTSALGRGKRVARRVQRAFDAAGVPVVLLAGADAVACQEAVRRAAGAGLRGLVLVGGDGLLGLVLQVAEARRLPIGIVPAGSGNDFARQFGFTGHPKRAVNRLLTATQQPQRVDLGVVTLPDETAAGGSREHWFGGGLSIGLDAAVNRRANALRLPLGPLRYHLALIAEIATLRKRHFTIAAGDEERTFTGILASVLNIRAIGGGIPLAPSAEPNDGMLDLVQVEDAGKRRLFSVLGVLAVGKHERLPEVSIVRAERVRIEAPGEIAYADGERVGEGPFEVRVAPGALTILA